MSVEKSPVNSKKFESPFWTSSTKVNISLVLPLTKWILRWVGG